MIPSPGMLEQDTDRLVEEMSCFVLLRSFTVRSGVVLKEEVQRLERSGSDDAFTGNLDEINECRKSNSLGRQATERWSGCECRVTRIVAKKCILFSLTNFGLFALFTSTRLP